MKYTEFMRMQKRYEYLGKLQESYQKTLDDLPSMFHAASHAPRGPGYNIEMTSIFENFEKKLRGGMRKAKEEQEGLEV